MPTSDENFDHLDPSLPREQVRDTYTRMREECPVVHDAKYGGFDFITRYAELRSALGSPERFSSADGVFIPQSGLPPIPALEFDDPEHARWRSALNPPLTPSAVRDLEPVILEIVDLLIDQFVDDGAAALMSQFAEPLPAIVIGRMVGLDQTQAVDAREIAAALFASIGTDEFEDHMVQFADYTQARIAERREEPRDDFLTQMASVVVEGIGIDDDAATGLMVAYLVGGHHSTASGLSGLLHHILTVDGLKDGLSSTPNLLRPVIEESLRLTTPLQLFARTTQCPMDIGGEALPAGRRVMLNLASANRDPRQFPDPEEFRTDRRKNPHVAFGAGAHVCQGQHLARAELRIAASRLLERLPGLSLDGDPLESGLIGGSLMTHVTLPVTFRPWAAQ